VAYGEERVVAVGAHGTIIDSRDLIAWTQRDSGTTADLFGLGYCCGEGGSDLYAVGQAGTILKFTGSAWQRMASGTTANLYGVSTWIVGEGGIILTTANGGQSFHRLSTSTTRDLHNASCGAWIGGDNGTILSTRDGTSFSLDPTATGVRIRAVTCDSLGFAFGDKGTLLEGTAGGWMPITSGTTVDFIGATALAAVNETGTEYVGAMGSDGSSYTLVHSKWVRVPARAPASTLAAIAWMDSSGFGQLTVHTVGVGAAGLIIVDPFTPPPTP
jgi:photosystem II stability/assembly factor-like uncharacterized protein